jgi:HEPN domain-containing protein
MALDPVLVENTRAWLEKGSRDLERVERILSGEPVDLEDGLFHSQQASEKALKAFLTWHDEPFRRIHDLTALSEQCSAIDAGLKNLLDDAGRLTEYAWIFRYPGASVEPTLLELKEAYGLAKDVYKAIAERLPPECQPPPYAVR